MSPYSTTSPDSKTEAQRHKSWREVLPVHPAAELFPSMSEAELRELGDDIKKRGQRVPVTIFQPVGMEPKQLLDGCNRLDAMAMVELPIIKSDGTLDDRVVKFEHAYADPARGGVDPFAYVLSANIHRRHLTAEQKNELIDKLIKANPEKSNRQLAEHAKVGHPRIARRRKRLEDKRDVERRSTSIDTKGREQPATKRSTKTPKPVQATTEVPETTVGDGPEAAAEKRKAESAAADALPTDMKPWTGKVNAKDMGLDEFTGHVLRLAQMTRKAEPERFAKTAVKADDLAKLTQFFADLTRLKKETAR
jgi:hypothetical protein